MHRPTSHQDSKQTIEGKAMQSMSGDIDPLATQIADNRTGIESGHLCKVEVAAQIMKWQERSPVPGQRFARQLVSTKSAM